MSCTIWDRPVLWVQVTRGQGTSQVYVMLVIEKDNFDPFK